MLISQVHVTLHGGSADPHADKMAGIQLKPPELFNFQNPDDWTRWRDRFEQFRVAFGLADEDAVQQIALLYGRTSPTHPRLHKTYS